MSFAYSSQNTRSFSSFPRKRESRSGAFWLIARFSWVCPPLFSRLPPRVTWLHHLQGLKVHPNRGETQRPEAQPRQSGDWRSQEEVFFFGDDLQGLAKDLQKTCEPTEGILILSTLAPLVFNCGFQVHTRSASWRQSATSSRMARRTANDSGLKPSDVRAYGGLFSPPPSRSSWSPRPDVPRWRR